MNLFYLDPSPIIAAQNQCDKHVVKMIVETAQMLSTAHRVVDGKQVIHRSKTNRRLKYWQLEDNRESILYKPAHVNHPSTVWLRTTLENYMWGYKHLEALCQEYTHRYGKRHKTEALLDTLKYHPRSIDNSSITPVPLAMGSNPECIDTSDPLGSYRKYYITKQDRFKMVWTKRDIPSWFEVK